MLASPTIPYVNPVIVGVLLLLTVYRYTMCGVPYATGAGQGALSQVAYFNDRGLPGGR